jgi:hypothetical protein
MLRNPAVQSNGRRPCNEKALIEDTERSVSDTGRISNPFEFSFFSFKESDQSCIHFFSELIDFDPYTDCSSRLKGPMAQAVFARSTVFELQNRGFRILPAHRGAQDRFHN